MADLTIDVRMEPAEDDNDTPDTGTLTARVSDQGGSPMESATVRVEAVSGGYSNEKSPPGYGTGAQFENVPNTDLRVTIEATGYQTIEIDVSADDWGGSDITRGY